jgi:D-beta-D-heptose 7-phosphate kinase/D-beta-D-heptose 1-phosphate adenosyltransferase
MSYSVADIIEKKWQEMHVLVVGDVMLDQYVWGEAERISPEAPIPIVNARSRTERPGGAANVAMNIAGLGARATLFGFRGSDLHGDILDRKLRDAGVVASLSKCPGRPTTSKVRVFCGHNQVVRLDVEKTDPYSPEQYRSLLANIHSAVFSADAIVLSDYAKGVLADDVCYETIRIARSRGIPVLVDPKRSSFACYRGATTICPNLSELSIVVGIAPKYLDKVLTAAQELVTELELNCLIATLSEKGIAILRTNSRFIDPALAREVFDISGAGDTVISTLVLAITSGMPMETAVRLANIAAGVVVRKIGTVPITRNELLQQLEREMPGKSKILSLDQLKRLVSNWRSAGETIVLTNGCFDLLHVGHVTLLEEASRAGDRLIVAINSDAGVRRLKNSSRPIVDEGKRARVLAALAVVDAVIVFKENTPLHLIEALRPDVIVKGGDYSEHQVVGAQQVHSWGGRVQIVARVKGCSTTELIGRLQQASKCSSEPETCSVT